MAFAVLNAQEAPVQTGASMLVASTTRSHNRSLDRVISTTDTPKTVSSIARADTSRAGEWRVLVSVGAPDVRDSAAPSAPFYARTDVTRAGISNPLAETVQHITSEPAQQSEGSHRIKHAAIGAGVGAGVGLAIGAAIGMSYDRSGNATVPATPYLAAEGFGIGLLAGLVIGALVK